MATQKVAQRTCEADVNSLVIVLPLSDEQAKAVVVAADAFGVEPWETAVHVLQSRRWFK